MKTTKKKTPKRITTHKSERTIQRAMKELRHFIDHGGGSEPETRVAYIVECALVWALEETKGFDNPLQEVQAQARWLKQGI